MNKKTRSRWLGIVLVLCFQHRVGVAHFTFRVREPNGLIDCKALPGRTQLGMREQIEAALDSEERVQDPRISKVDLGGLDQALTDVLEPRHQLPDHECPGQHVEVVADRVFTNSHRSSELGRVPYSRMKVSQHCPESA